MANHLRVGHEQRAGLPPPCGRVHAAQRDGGDAEVEIRFLELVAKLVWCRAPFGPAERVRSEPSKGRRPQPEHAEEATLGVTARHLLDLPSLPAGGAAKTLEDVLFARSGSCRNARQAGSLEWALMARADFPRWLAGENKYRRCFRSVIQ